MVEHPPSMLEVLGSVPNIAKNKELLSLAKWCTPVIPATQETVAEGSGVQGQPGHLRENLSQKHINK